MIDCTFISLYIVSSYSVPVLSRYSNDNVNSADPHSSPLGNHRALMYQIALISLPSAN